MQFIWNFTKQGGSDRNWFDFWNNDNSIYVSKRHIQEHYKAVVRDVSQHLMPHAALLDFGCGYALSTDAFVVAGHTLYLYDPVPKMREFIAERYGNNPSVHIVGSMESIPDHALDAILVHSVLQYVPKGEIQALLRTFHQKLRKGGVLLLSDLVPPQVSIFTELFAVLRAALAHGFFFAACLSYVRTFFSDYRKIRREAGFSTFDEKEALALLEGAGFTAGRIPNISLLSHRLAIKGVK